MIFDCLHLAIELQNVEAYSIAIVEGRKPTDMVNELHNAC